MNEKDEEGQDLNNTYRATCLVDNFTPVTGRRYTVSLLVSNADHVTGELAHYTVKAGSEDETTLTLDHQPFWYRSVARQGDHYAFPRFDFIYQEKSGIRGTNNKWGKFTCALKDTVTGIVTDSNAVYSFEVEE